MRQRRIGSHGPSVGNIGMGCMAMAGWYGTRDDRAAAQAINRAIDLGVTLFDTADLYGGGENERFVGEVIGQRRGRVVFGTKFGCTWDNAGRPVGVCATPAYCQQACEDSLARLGFDHIDIYYLHRVDLDVPIEETVGAMSRLIEQGKVRWIGMSETRPETLRRAHATHPVTALQTEYSLWSREPEDGLFELCEEFGIGFVAYAPLGRGLLTGAVKSLDDLPEDDLRRHIPRFQGDRLARNYELIEAMRSIAADKGCTLPQLALAWVLGKQANVVPIQGADRVPFVEENAAAAEIELTAAEIGRLDAANPPGIAAGERYPEAWMGEVNR